MGVSSTALIENCIVAIPPLESQTRGPVRGPVFLQQK